MFCERRTDPSLDGVVDCLGLPNGLSEKRMRSSFCVLFIYRKLTVIGWIKIVRTIFNPGLTDTYNIHSSYTIGLHST